MPSQTSTTSAAAPTSGGVVSGCAGAGLTSTSGTTESTASTRAAVRSSVASAQMAAVAGHPKRDEDDGQEISPWRFLTSFMAFDMAIS